MWTQPKILHRHLPVRPWAEPGLNRLPGTGLIGPDDWAMTDECFGAQMALADRLIATRPEEVIADSPDAEPAARELLDLVLDRIEWAPGYQTTATEVTRPDGVTVPLDHERPLITARRLVQEDLLLHLEGPNEHYLAAGVLAFPASWSLGEKMRMGLRRIHGPVAPYTDDVAARVQRLFNGLQPKKPIMRSNFLTYAKPDLFHPATEAANRDPDERPNYLRVERQCLMRLPVTRTVVFTIHTFVLAMDALEEADRRAILAARGHATP